MIFEIYLVTKPNIRPFAFELQFALVSYNGLLTGDLY